MTTASVILYDEESGGQEEAECSAEADKDLLLREALQHRGRHGAQRAAERASQERDSHSEEHLGAFECVEDVFGRFMLFLSL